MTAKRKQLTKQERQELSTDTSVRRERVPLAQTRRLGFPPNVKREDDKYYSWVKDDEKGTVGKYQDAYYDFVRDGNGKQFVVRSGEDELVLMMQLKKYRDEDCAIEQRKCIDTVQRKAALQAGEYVPQGFDAVVSRGV